LDKTIDKGIEALTKKTEELDDTREELLDLDKEEQKELKEKLKLKQEKDSAENLKKLSEKEIPETLKPIELDDIKPDEEVKKTISINE
jgi:phage-related protein